MSPPERIFFGPSVWPTGPETWCSKPFRGVWSNFFALFPLSPPYSSIYLSIYLTTYLSIHISIHRHSALTHGDKILDLVKDPEARVFIYLSIYRSTYLSIYSHIYPSAFCAHPRDGDKMPDQVKDPEARVFIFLSIYLTVCPIYLYIYLP